jgi:C1A family cysteine protease
VSGLSREEFSRLLGVPLEVMEWEQSQARLEAAELPGSYSYPPSWDWRNVGGQDYTTPIRNQGNCGSCVAFGANGAIESRLEVNQQNPALNADLSEAHLFYCGCGNCCDTGWDPRWAMDFAHDTGVADEACFPYQPFDQPCAPCQDWESRVTKVCGWYGATSTAHMKQALVDSGPFEATFRVYEDFGDYTGGVYRHEWGEYLGGHAVTIVGYDDTEGYWVVKNSWGTGWGESGWFRIAYGECYIDDYAYIPLASSDCSTAYVSLAMQNCRLGHTIHGRVTQNGTAASGVPVQLRLYDGFSSSTIATVNTRSDGTYRFRDVPNLLQDQAYFVCYVNTAGTPGRLWAWYTGWIRHYTGCNLHAGDFDIADIELVSPADGATVSLPRTFYWSPRPATPSDDYELDLYDPVDYDPLWYTYPTLGYVGSYTLNSLPSGFSPWTEYSWEIWVYGPGGVGISYDFRDVIFSNAGVGPPESAVPDHRMPPDDMEGFLPRR